MGKSARIELENIKKLSEAVFSKRGPVKMGSWRGVRAIRYPTDLIVYAEIIHEQKPDLIVETGTRYGGTALFLADMCRLNNKGKVISIEIDEQYEAQKHPKLTNIRGSSIAPEVVEQVKESAKETALVILDSDHSAEHVSAELNAYAPLIHIGGYIIVEDIYAEENTPHAVEIFLKKNPNFVRDTDAEKYGIHAARDGFLKRVS